MGDTNQLRFVRRHLDRLAGPVLEIGSQDYGSTPDFRSLFPNERYLGVDMTEGPGVDRVLDLTDDFSDVDRALEGARFGTILCLSVLEHCRQPFQMADNLTRLLADGGALVVSVPFAWQFHGYPSDYWRFTHEGVKQLFPRIDFESDPIGAASVSGHEFAPLDSSIGRLSFRFGENWKNGHRLRACSAKALRLLARAGLLRWLARRPYVLAPTMVSMIGFPGDDARKPATPQPESSR